MALNIIIDKSTFQSLSYDEMLRLTFYYKHNIAPVLVMEIIGDLKKEVKDSKPSPNDRVKDFATKLFPTNTIINQFYVSLARGELSGDGLVELDGRPIVRMEKAVQTADGRKGWIVGETEEEEAIYNWREGKFSEADHILSKMWRDTTTKDDLLVILKKRLEDKRGKVDIKNFSELDNYVTEILDDPANQHELIINLCRIWNINVYQSFGLVKAWHQARCPNLKTFLPYVHYITRVNLLFETGLLCGLISTRPTNKVDIQYLYYLPFCQVFTSNNLLHLNLAPLLLREDQYFIKGTDLKNDLHFINECSNKMNDDERDQFKKSPPLNQDSFTFRCYHRYFDYPNGWQWTMKTSKKQKAEALNLMKSFEKANQGEPIEMSNGDVGSFVTRVTKMGRNEPCFCGSGKKLIGCCLSNQQFDEALKLQNSGEQEDRIKIGSAEYLGPASD